MFNKKENRIAPAAALCASLCTLLCTVLLTGSCSFLPELPLDEWFGDHTADPSGTSAAPENTHGIKPVMTGNPADAPSGAPAAPSFTASGETYTDSDENFWFNYEDLYGRNAPHSSMSKYSSLFSDKLGSGGDLRGTTVVVSIFADDESGRWDFNDTHDCELRDTIRNNLGIACSWITKSAKDYGVDAYFIYDFDKNQDLAHHNRFDINFEEQIDDSISDKTVWEYIEESIDTKALLEKYRAQNIIYLLYLDNPQVYDEVSCTRSNYSGMEYPYEICFFFMNDGEYTETPAVFAHEMLHTFGAPDLYCEDTQYGITQEYVDYAEEALTNDIMRDCYDIYYGTRYYDYISNEITGITAYYIGWTDHSDEVEYWDLGESEHILRD